MRALATQCKNAPPLFPLWLQLLFGAIANGLAAVVFFGTDWNGVCVCVCVFFFFFTVFDVNRFHRVLLFAILPTFMAFKLTQTHKQTNTHTHTHIHTHSALLAFAVGIVFTGPFTFVASLRPQIALLLPVVVALVTGDLLFSLFFLFVFKQFFIQVSLFDRLLMLAGCRDNVLHVNVCALLLFCCCCFKLLFFLQFSCFVVCNYQFGSWNIVGDWCTRIGYCFIVFFYCFHCFSHRFNHCLPSLFLFLVCIVSHCFTHCFCSLGLPHFGYGSFCVSNGCGVFIGNWIEYGR
jgi:hypothetical protein